MNNTHPNPPQEFPELDRPAVTGIKFEITGVDCDDFSPDLLCDLVEENWPDLSQAETIRQPGFNNNGPVTGLGWKSTDGRYHLRLTRHGFCLRQLSGYAGWKDWLDKVTELANFWFIAAAPRSLASLSLQYTNRLPLQRPVPHRIWSRASEEIKPSGLLVHRQTSIDGAGQDHQSLVLETEVLHLSPQAAWGEELDSLFEDMRHQKTRAFFASLDAALADGLILPPVLAGRKAG